MLSGCAHQAERDRASAAAARSTGLNSQAQLRPARKVGTAQGRKTSACDDARGRGNGWSSSSARIRPKTNCRTTRAAGPPEGVRRARGRNCRSPQQLAEMIEPDEAAAERVEQLDVAEGIGDAERQRHQHHRDDQDQRRRAVEIGLERAARRASRGLRCAAVGERRSGHRPCSRAALAPSWLASGRRPCRSTADPVASDYLLREELLLGLGQVVGPLLGQLLRRDARRAGPPGWS